MTPDNEPEEHIDELLEDDDDLLTPDEDQPEENEEAPEPEPDPKPEAPEEKPKPDAPNTAPEPAVTPSRSGSLLLVLIMVVLLASVVGLGLYCGSLKGQIDQLNGDIEDAQAQSQLNQSTTANVAADIAPLAKELALIAKVKAEMGNVAGAQVELDQAKKYMALIGQLGGGADEVQTIIDEAEALIAGDAPDEDPVIMPTDEAVDEAIEALESGSEEEPELLDAPVVDPAAADDTAATDDSTDAPVEPIVDSQALTAPG